ncbi:MAG TPA: TRAM domain-containing protein [Aggregatilineales bacterium]|nr:TRAM domain-containing protein [Aggregatilineales bacterium]
MSEPSGDTFEITLDAMAHGGRALGRHGKQTVFIPYAIPGERVLARITEDRGRIAFAEGLSLIEASADRVFPACRHFGPGRCGRCQWQHIEPGAQTLLKFDVLADQLARIGGFGDALLEAVLQPVIPAPQVWGYNYHMTLTVTPDGQLGFLSTDGDGTTIIEECHILHPELLALYHQLDLDVSAVQRLRLQWDSDGSPMVIISVTDEDEMPELETDLPLSINALLPDNEPVNLIGSSHSRYTVNGRTFRVTAGSEFRPNLSQLPALVAAVIDGLALPPRSAVLDLYGGVGLFSAFLAPEAALVTLVESYPPAATDADDNLADFEHVDIYEATVEDFLDGLEDAYDAAVLDPPPSGLSLEVVDALGALAIPRLALVSSDPATLARDSQRLTQHGYRLTRVQPIDLAPQTYYIDAVAVFERAT